jgi:hypothetical protein
MNLTVDTKENLDTFGTLCPSMADAIIAMVKLSAPELRGSIPFTNGWKALVYRGAEQVIIIMHDAGGIPSISSLSGDYLNFIKTEVGTITPLNFEMLNQKFGDRFYGTEIFLYAGPSFINDTPIDRFKKAWTDVGTFLGPYVQDVLIPKLYEMERSKIAKLMPPPRNYDLKSITSALWILECERSSKQGTAFALQGYGLITCEHVLGPETQVFRADNYSKKYPVRLIKKNDVIDLALLKIEGFELKDFLTISESEPVQLGQIMVYGFPNYQYGDTGTINIGNVAGFRMKSGIRRLLVSTPLIAGNSGSPVFDADSKVIGIAVTGAERMEEVHETEEHGVIPIGAIDLL